MGPFKCYVTLFFWKLDPHPPPRNANNIEYYTFVTLSSRKSETPPPPSALRNTEWPLCKRRLTWSPNRVESTNRTRLPSNAHAHHDVFQASLPWQEMVKLNKGSIFIITSSSSSLGSRCVPWLGEGLSMSSPNDPVLCCPLPYRVAPVFVQVVSPPLGWSPLTSFLVIWSPSGDARGPSVVFEAVDMPCPGPFHFSHSVDYIYEFCPLPNPDVGPSIFVCDVEHTSFHFGLCGRKFVLCLFGQCPGLCTICHSWQHTGVVHLSLQADGKVAFEDIPVFGVCRPACHDSSLYLFVLVLFLEAVVLSQVHVAWDIFYQHIVHVYRGVVYNHHLCHHRDTICYPKSGYVTTKLHGTSTYRRNNNAIFSDSNFHVSYRRRISATLIWPLQSIAGGCQSSEMASLLNSLSFAFANSFLPKYRVKYYDYIVKWCSGV